MTTWRTFQTHVTILLGMSHSEPTVHEPKRDSLGIESQCPVKAESPLAYYL